MRRSLFAAAFLLSSGLAVFAQTDSVKVKIQVILVDHDLNQKPVPHFQVTLQRVDKTGSEPMEWKTGLDGTAENSLAAGRYKIVSPKPIEFQGKRYAWNLEVLIRGAAQSIDLSNDNAKTEDLAADTPHPADAASSSSASGGDLTALFDRLKNSVVTVRAESRDGSGFLVDSSGLVVTNYHMVESSTYLAVQFDQKRKVAAKLLATNADKDVAVLWVNLAAFPEAIVAPMNPAGAASQIAVGQRVFTIGNPLGREKVLTTGVISKIEAAAITSDININPGNSGGPLFTLNGQVAGITTAGLRKLASIVPTAEVQPVIEQARRKMAGDSPPSAELLPVEPTDYFPVDSLRAVLQQEKLDTKPYFFDAGQFQVGITTPVVSYYFRHEDEMAAARKAAKRSGGDPSGAKPPASALEDAQDVRPVIMIRVRPKFGVFFKVRFKNGFQRMRLLCGGKELAPIDPGRGTFNLMDQRGRTIDTTYQGVYEYQPDAVSPACGGMVLEIYSEKDPSTPITKPIEAATVDRVWADLEPYRKAHEVK
jgi:S1-C subfamily serine protease